MVAPVEGYGGDETLPNKLKRKRSSGVDSVHAIDRVRKLVVAGTSEPESYRSRVVPLPSFYSAIFEEEERTECDKKQNGWLLVKELQ
jgi:hypothetical protein